MPSEKVQFYCSYLTEGRKICWPVRVLRTDEYGWSQVVGLSGRQKGRSFSIHRNELYFRVPTGANLAPGARAFVPQEGVESRRASLIRARIAKLPYAGEQSNQHLKAAERLYREVDVLGLSLYPRTSDDLAWKHYEESKERAKENLVDRRATAALRNIVGMIDMIRGAAERERT